MLRSKPTLCVSLYSLARVFSFSRVRHFHLTYCVQLRKVRSINQTLPEAGENFCDPTVAGKFHVEQNIKTNNNFYGIESDEGVIDITQRSQNIKLEQDVFISRIIKKFKPEKLVNLRFGSVRWDAENKPMFHGHFEGGANTKSAVQARSRLENVERLDQNIDPSKTSENQDIQEQFPINADMLQLKNRTPAESCDSQMHPNICDPENNVKKSFIDDLYFPREIIDDKLSNDSVCKTLSKASTFSNQHITDFKTAHSPKNESNNFMDELYISDEMAVNENNFKHIENLLKASQSQQQQTVKNSNIEDNDSFIEKSYFPNEIVQRENETSDPKDSTVGIKEKGLSYFDVCYFDNKLANENVNSQKDMNDKLQFSNRDVEKYPSDFNPEEILDFPKDFKLNTNYKIDQKEEKDYFNNATNNDLGLYAKDKKFGKPNLISESHSSLPKTHSAYNELLRTTEENLQKQLHKLSHRQNEQSSHGSKDVVKVKGNVREFREPNLAGNVIQRNHKIIENRSEEHSEFNKNEQKLKQGIKKEESNASNEIETAHDFVSKLRNERKLLRPMIKGGKVISPEEKKDSRGFRILENQVPKLQYFTRDEILTILKNNILYSDDDTVVLNKPYNLVIHESKTTKEACLSQYLDELAVQLDSQSKHPKLYTVHRLDKETCGCLLLARNETSAQRLKSLFAQRKIIKTYWIVTIAVPDPLEGVIDMPIAEGSVDNKTRMVLHPKIPEGVAYENHSKHGKRAVTYYKVISTSGNAALVQVQPETGIKHQIRVHFGFGLSCPILGDHKYSHLRKMAPQKLPSDMLQRLYVRQSKVRYIPMHIYARSICIPQYTEGKNLFVVAPMPTHISKNLQKLKFKKK